MGSDRRDRGHDLSELELVQHGALTRVIETDHKDTHLLFVAELGKQLGEREPHAFYSFLSLSIQQKKKKNLLTSEFGGLHQKEQKRESRGVSASVLERDRG